MPDNINLDNVNQNVSEVVLPASEWRFVGMAEQGTSGQIRAGGAGIALVIQNPAYVDGSRWEQTLPGLAPGLLLTLKGQARTQGPCLRSIGSNCYAAGTKITLQAIARMPELAESRLGAVEYVFYPPMKPDGKVQEDGGLEGALLLVVPDGADFIRVSAELSGQGTAVFSSLTLTAEAANPESMNDALVDRLKTVGTIHSPEVEQAFRHVPRHPFLPGTNWGRVYQDDAIATHFANGSNISISSSSQPTIMALMLEQLRMTPGMRVLEVGAGTGYNAALLAQLAGSGELVRTVDVDEPFCEEARAHLKAARISGVHVVCADGWGGWPEAAPYDRIIVTFSAYDISPAWFAQLREDGRLVVPWGAPHAQQRSIAFRKEGDCLVMESLHFCGFMPMRGAHAWSLPSEGGTGPNWQDWLFPGQPEGDPTSLIAYPLGTAPTVSERQHLVKRTWFEYVASWE